MAVAKGARLMAVVKGCPLGPPLVADTTPSLTSKTVKMLLPLGCTTSSTMAHGRYADPVLVVQLYSFLRPARSRPSMGAMIMRAASPDRVVSPTGKGAISFSPQCRPLLMMPAWFEGVDENLKMSVAAAETRQRLATCEQRSAGAGPH
jgi:hypothetical protein